MKYFLTILLLALMLPLAAQEVSEVIYESKTLTSVGDTAYYWTTVTVTETGAPLKDTLTRQTYIGDSTMAVQTLYRDQLQNREDGRLGWRAMGFVLQKALKFRFLQAEWYQDFTSSLSVIDSNLVAADVVVAGNSDVYGSGTWLLFDAENNMTQREWFISPANGLHFLRNVNDPTDRIRIEPIDKGIFQLVAWPAPGLRTTFIARDDVPGLWTPTDFIFAGTVVRIRSAQ